MLEVKKKKKKILCWKLYRVFTSFRLLCLMLKGRYFICVAFVQKSGASLVAQRVKHLPAMQETWVQSLGWEDPPEKEMATHSSILTWRIPWMEEPGRLQSTGLRRVRNDWATSLTFLSKNQPRNWGTENKKSRFLLKKKIKKALCTISLEFLHPYFVCLVGFFFFFDPATRGYLWS